MNRKELNKLFIENLNLNELGFNIYETNANNVTYFRKSNEKVDKINFTFYKYEHFEYGGLGVGIQFNEVENIFQEFNLEYKFEGNMNFNQTINIDKVSRIENMKRSKECFGKSLQDKKSVVDLAKILKEEIKEHLEPYFEKFQRIEDVYNDIIVPTPPTELGQYIGGIYMPYKKLYILKKCNDPNYEEYKNWLYGLLEKKVNEEPNKYGKLYEFAQEFNEKIESK